MFFSKLRLKNFKRTALAGYKDIEITPASNLMVILGTNGCGKTSMTRQFTPWLPEQEHFLPGGEKEFWCTKDGVSFRTLSTLKSSWKHEFWRENENLNPGGTASVQKELLKRYFGLTQEIFSLLVGDIKFHLLPVSKRRELFTELSPTDLSYAIGVYNRLKTALRDAQGVRKHLNGRIAQETAKVLDDATAAQYADQAKQLNEEVELLLGNKDQRTNHTTANQRLNSLREELSGRLERLQELSLTHSGVTGFESLEELQKRFHELSHKHSAETARRQQMLSEFVDLSATIAEIKNRSVGSKEEVEASLARVNAELGGFKTEFDFQMPEEAKQAYQETLEFEASLSAYTLQLANWLSDGSDFSKAAQEACNASIEKAIDEQRVIRRHIEAAKNRLAHLEHSDEVDCPQCKTKFVPGERAGERTKLKELLERGDAADQVKLEELKTLGEQAERFVEFQQTVQKIRQMASAYPRCRGLFDSMVEHGLPYATTQRTANLLWNWKSQLETCFKLKQLQKNKQQLEEALEQIRLAGDDSEVLLSERSARLERECHELGLELDQCARELKLLESAIATHTEFLQHKAVIEERLLPAHQTAVADALVGVRNRIIDEVLDQHYAQLGFLNSRLKERDVAVALLKDLEQQLEECGKREVALGVLIDEISPSDGLIAEQLSGFIASFVKLANVILDKIWSYPLRILPCGIEQEELDYKFPIEVGSERERGNDVACGSEAQRDVFDFVFVLVLGSFVEFPLFLDELGSSFDEEHRAKVWSFVRDYVDAGRAPQAFMISHYAANHTALTNADLVVVDAENITVPRKYNECIVFK